MLNQEEREILIEINSTEGAEYGWQCDVLDSLKTKGLVTFSSGRGPGNKWYRVELTEQGLQSIAKGA